MGIPSYLAYLKTEVFSDQDHAYASSFILHHALYDCCETAYPPRVITVLVEPCLDTGKVQKLGFMMFDNVPHYIQRGDRSDPLKRKGELWSK
jgi:hypothetical protein